MTVIAVKDEQISAKKKMSEKFLRYGKRSMTDIGGFGIPLFIIILIVCPLIDRYMVNRPTRLNYCNCLLNMNKSLENSTHTNETSEVIYNIPQIANSITHIIKAEVVLRDFNLWQIRRIVEIMVAFWMMMKCSVLGLKIFAKSMKDAELSVHLLMINVIKIVVTLIFLFGTNFRPNGSWNIFQQVTDWLSIDPSSTVPVALFSIGGILVCSQILIGDESKVQIKTTFRFYIACWNLLLFRCLILISMILLSTFMIIRLKDVLKLNSVEILIYLAILYVVFCLHEYGKLIIMTATASHDWQQNINGVSFVALLSAIAIVTRYHLGSVFLGRFYKTIILTDFYDKDYTHVYSSSDSTQLLKMFTASLGLNINQAIERLNHLRTNNPSPFISKNKSHEVWVTFFKMSLLWLLMAFKTSDVESLETLKTKLIMIFVYFCIAGTVHYIVTGISLIENTIQFCKIEVDYVEKPDYWVALKVEETVTDSRNSSN